MKTIYNNPNINWYHKKMSNPKQGYFSWVVTIIVLIVFSVCVSSCKTIKYVPVETVKTEYINKVVHDSIKVETLKHDSVVIQQKGDTIVVDRFHYLYKDKWKERLVSDTVIKIDSIRVPYPVEKPLSKWDKVCLKSGNIAIIVCVIIVVVLGLGVIFRKRVNS